MLGDAETQSLFLERLPEAEEAEEAPVSPGVLTQGRRLSAQRDNRRVAFATAFSLAAAGCLAIAARPGAAWPGTQAPAVARLDSAQGKSATIAPYQQCGGQDWTNGTCCQTGCACVAKSKYYSMCRTPTGIDECDEDQVKIEAQAAKRRVDSRKSSLEIRRSALKTAGAELRTAREELAKAETALNEASQAASEKDSALEHAEATLGRSAKNKEKAAREEHERITKETKATLAEKTQSATETRDRKLKAAHDAHAAAEKAAKDAREAFDNANKKAADKTTERAQVKVHVDEYEAGEKARQEKDCGELYGACTATNCCVLGCQPYWKNQYFCQCKGPNQAGYCAAKEAMDLYTKSSAAMPYLNRDYHALIKANDTAATTLVDADKNLEEVAEKSKHDIKAAKEEYERNTKGPEEDAANTLKAAQETADRKIKEAKEELHSKTAKSREAWKEAHKVKDEKEKIAKEKRAAEKLASDKATAADAAVTKASHDLVTSKGEVGAWVRAARGDTCGQDDDGLALDF
uniref:CBM1 domain-containing protein n=1 Tax=Alexandrium monilatum TaxID=311494 RepID=A0A6T0RID1_9DINO|mmetsp:Transcript_63801/g.190108  ORF Transcript_63801/g.190108 Transcript_63801/m.190108 type:complete len:520 (+) Transcript_63801:58-1617(+)